MVESCIIAFPSAAKLRFTCVAFCARFKSTLCSDRSHRTAHSTNQELIKNFVSVQNRYYLQQMSCANKEKHSIMILCRQCGGPHFTIRCPQRSPEDTAPKSWRQQVDEFEQRVEAKPFKCTILLHAGREERVYSDDIAEFWEEIRIAYEDSLYRDFVGIRKLDDGDGASDVLFPPDYAFLDPGEYRLVSRTHGLSDKDLFSIIADGVSMLKQYRSIMEDDFKSVQSKLLLLFNHFSLSHEGNALNLDETRMLTELLAGKDWKRLLEEEETLDKELRRVPGSENDIREATNHILVSEKLEEIAESRTTVDETMVLQLHAWVMHGLLKDPSFGGGGEYRKTKIGVMGSTQGRPPSADVPPLMKRFFETTMVRRDEEDIFEYLSRIHAQFQYIHPFVDGNGRIGRLIMNIILMQHGYSVLVLPTTLSYMFNHGVEVGYKGDLSLFTRLLAESAFKSLGIYEEALQVKLLPTAQELVENLSMAAAPRTASP